MKDNVVQKTYLGIRLDFLICIIIGLITFCVYLQVLNFEFINLDDDRYVYENYHVQNGLTLKSIGWSFSLTDKHLNKTYWHPLTWLSHILDCHLYGLNAGMHHLTNLVIHILNCILLFVIFNRMTGELWKSAFIAAAFALHPINVDSVAWVAERKNILSTFFWMLTILTYVIYSERPKLSRYLLTCLVFVLGLLAKPMLVTLPCVLLLLDYWPLKRIRHVSISSIAQNIIEKVPLFILAGISIYLSTASLRETVPMISLDQRPMDLRIANALVSYLNYIEKIIWPQNLAVHYPYPSYIPIWKTVCAGFLLVLITLLVILALKRRPYLLTGWFWFIGTLVPVIGLMQAGLWPAMADRWAYIPMIGLLIMITWSMFELLERWQYKTKYLMALPLVITVILIPVTWNQVQYWDSSISLFNHNLKVAGSSYLAHSNLGFALANQGKIDEAEIHYHEALKLNPFNAYAHNNLGISLAKKNRINEAIKHFTQAVHLNPIFPAAHNNLGQALALQLKLGEAVKHFKEALRMDPEFLEAHYNLGNALLKQGEKSEAIRHFSSALRINPSIGEIHRTLGEALVAQEKLVDATECIKRAIKLDPNNADAYKNFGDIMRHQGKLREAIVHYSKAIELRPASKEAQISLGETHFMLGRISLGKGELNDAIVHFKKALRINNNFAEAHTHLGYALLKQGKEDEALKHCYEAIRIDPEKSISAYYNLACIYSRRNKVNESVDWLKKAIDKGFNDWNALKDDKDLENIRNTVYYIKITTK